RVTISPQKDETRKTVNHLWQHLEGYIQPPNSAPQPPMSAIPKPVRSLHRAVVCVYAIGKNQEIQLTGFAVDSRGFIVCTGHDLRSAQMVSLLLSDGREIEGVVVKIDPVRDLALLQASTALDAVIPLRNGRFMLSNGDRLFAITCPFGGMANIEPGFLDGPPRRVAGLPLWQVQMHIDPGSSGSPVFDRQGRLVAIVKGRYRGTDSIGFLIPFETLLHFLEKY
ncbi:MAG: serine protease, partial [Desulfobacteraceae bacterium]